MISHTRRYFVGTYKEYTIALYDESGNEKESVELIVYDKGEDKPPRGFITVRDDSGAFTVFSADKIDDLVEALQRLKGEL